jgi:hypothetical protein
MSSTTTRASSRGCRSTKAGASSIPAYSELEKHLDPTRLVDGPSGGNHFPAGDIIDHHQYPGPSAPAAVRIVRWFLGNSADYVALLQKLQPMIEEKGLSAAIYTQTTDVEVEVNGLMTYDRVVVKMPGKSVANANKLARGVSEI